MLLYKLITQLQGRNMQKTEKVSKEYEHLTKQIISLLKDFQRNREWADIGNWLSRLQPVLAAKKHNNLPRKIQLAKRLAQCLNPNLPAGIHGNTLGVYNTIFNNFDCKNHILPLFSIGLFPFFEYSSSSLKMELLKIFQNHYIKTTDCLQMITSLMNAILTGLNENNEELAKKIYSICDIISNNYGRMWVDGAVWINILKSPKVRIAGFKYFMKTFKDRDKLKKVQPLNEEGTKQQKIDKNEEQIKQNILQQAQTEIEPSAIGVAAYDSFLSQSNEYETNIQVFSQLSKVKNMGDTYKSRFPNFSTLVVSALCQCLQSPISDTLVRRSALDLLIFYLKLDNKQLITEKDGVHIVSVLLQTIKIKQYSLTRRIYTYLFGQPNTQGHYIINENERSYQLYLLRISLEKMLFVSEQPTINKANSEGNLMILQIILKDHEKLRQLILPQLAYEILTFLRFATINAKRITEFYLNVLQPSDSFFTKALEIELISDKAIQDARVAKDIVSTIDYFYTLKNQIQIANKSQIPQEEIMCIIELLLKYLSQTQCSQQKLSIQILELCNKFIRLMPTLSKQLISQQSIKLLNSLIILRPVNSIYAGLLTLHPLPAKQNLLPFMNETSLSIVCISNLLSISPQDLSEQEKGSIFFSIFKLLNCHLWEDQAIEFIKLYKQKYPNHYAELIDQTEPSEWLIYWKKMSGDVDGGVIRMLRNLDHDNHLNKQLSKKWLENSKQICSRVADPIYKLMKQESLQNMKDVYHMVKKVFSIQKSDFTAFFFLQRQRYFLPLIDKVFQCINSNNEDLKANSINMLQFLMERAGDIDQKLTFIQTTIVRSIEFLQKILGGKGNYERQIQTIQYFISMVDLINSFKGHPKKIQKLQILVQSSKLYEKMAMGMKQTNLPYVRTLYIDFIQKSTQAFAEISSDQRFMSQIITCVLQRLLMMLRENDVTSLEQIIRGKFSSQSPANKRKKSQMINSLDPQNVSQTQFNVQSKYAQVIQLWNTVKFMVNVSIQIKIQDLPIQKLLSLILQSFPFSEINYKQVSPEMIEVNYEQLQQEIRNMTGLKKEVLEIFQTLWDNHENKIITFLIDKGDPRVLIHGSVDPNAVIKAITKSSQCLKIAKHFKGTKFILPKGTIHYKTQILLVENQVNYFLYLYLLYCNLSLKNGKKVNNFVELILNLIKSMKVTSHIQTKIWILQMLYCLFERIPFRDLHLDNTRLKSQFQEMTKQLLEELCYVIAKSRTFTHKAQIKTGLFNIFGKQEGKQSSLFDFVKIFPPTIYHMHQNYVQKNKNRKSEMMISSDDFISYFLFNKWTNLDESNYSRYLSVVCIKTFSELFIPLLTNIYENDISKISAMTREWLLILFPLYENKSEENQLYLETVSQFLRVLLNHQSLRPQIIKNMRKNILEIYMGNDFFKCTKNTLNYWKYIIDCCTENYDLLGELLSRQGLFEGLFTRKAESTRVKIKNFERVCFVIFSGRVDKYENKLKVVLESLNEVMKSENPSPALLILILFCIRILVMRLSETSLSRMFRSFWPSLITLLIQIYTKQVFSSCINLLLAGLKVIQLLHALDLEQFNIHKWLFVFDYFGIRIDSQTESEQLLTGNSKSILTPFKFNPILTKFLPQNPLKCTFVPEVWPDQSIEPGKRKLIVKQASIQSEQELRNHALILMQYMIDLNQRRVTVVKQEIQDLIQADFISLDDYIFSVK